MQKVLLCKEKYAVALSVLQQIAEMKYPYSPKFMKLLAQSSVDFLTTQPDTTIIIPYTVSEIVSSINKLHQ